MRTLLPCWLLSLVFGSELVDRTSPAATFDGIGGLSGGGATSRLLPDYQEPAKTQILDYLFKPNFGASLQILKVEIGGDSQSTDGTESSHMHNSETVDLKTGYEWWLMKEAKKRNPDIKLYGLAWAFPGWVGNHSGSPFDFPDLTAKYLVEWVKGAKSEYDLDIDYLGIWNERSSDSTFVQTLRKALNAAGIAGTKIVVKDGGADICNDLAKDKPYADAVDIIGLHYPSDFQDYSVCKSLGKPIWSSEESSSYDDMNGAACWGRIINAHWVINQMTSSIMWNLVGAYYHGTNWYASSMLTSVEPWSGHYEVNPTIWATAHVTQFTEIGWQYLANGEGSGELPGGGYYVTWVDPDSEHFTMSVIKIDHDHAACTRPKLPDFNVSAETVTFKLAASMKAPKALQVWTSSFQSYGAEEGPMFQHSTVDVVNGEFQLKVKIGDMVTITTLTDRGHKGSFDKIPESSPSFPLPYSDDFQDIVESQDAKWFADQIGAFEAHKASDGKMSLVQMVPELPIGWSDHGSNGPMSLIGMREWQDLEVSASFQLPKASENQTLGRAADAACLATRVDQMWANGVVICVNAAGQWNLTNSGPPLQDEGRAPPANVASGQAAASAPQAWRTLKLRTEGNKATAWLDGKQIVEHEVRDLDTGFAAIGANGWLPVAFRDFSIQQTSGGWTPPTSCDTPKQGAEVTVQPCARNGLVADDQTWTLLPSFQLQHGSGLCASAGDDGKVTLEVCDRDSIGDKQLFVNDYTRIRNTEEPITVASLNKPLAGSKSGGVAVGSGDWKTWSYFPNTKQLRNQYTAKTNLGYPMCLSSCPSSPDTLVV